VLVERSGSAGTPSRVALFVTCTVDSVAPAVGTAAVRLLEACGVEVVIPRAQTCCGQPAANSGAPEAAAIMARHFIEVFEPFEAIVSPSGSCVAMVHHWFSRLFPDSGAEAGRRSARPGRRGHRTLRARADDARWRARAEAVAARTHELTDYIVNVLDRPDVGARIGDRVTVHDSCHGLRVLGLGGAGRAMLRAAGAEIVEMADPEACCGFGGTFALSHGAVSTAMADAKLGDAAITGAACLVGGDAGCLVHLEGRRRRSGLGPPNRHIAEVIAEGLP
jgi:L-lactate dehydrogenase complex protein LldE